MVLFVRLLTLIGLLIALPLYLHHYADLPVVPDRLFPFDVVRVLYSLYYLLLLILLAHRVPLFSLAGLHAQHVMLLNDIVSKFVAK